MTRIFEAFKNNDEDIRIYAMQILVEIARQEYESIEFFFAQLCNIAADGARGEDEKLGVQGIEFWTSIAEEEIARTKKGSLVKGYIS